MSGPIDPDATMPVQGGGYPGTADPTLAGPNVGQGGGTTGGGGEGDGTWDDDGDRRRLWLIAGAVLLLGLLVGALIAVLASGGNDDKGTTTTSSSTTSSSTSTSTSSSTTTTVQPAVQILSFTVNNSTGPVSVECPAGGGGSINVQVKWSTANTQSVTVGIDSPVPFQPPFSAPTGQVTAPFACADPGPDTQHKYYLTAYAGPNATGVAQQDIITVNGTAPAGPPTSGP
jgi:hypothetical protein